MLNTLFTPATYQERRARLKSKLSGGQILLLGNEESSMNYGDNHYPFRQDSTFRYFFGLNQPGLAGLIDVDKDEVILFGNDLSMDDIVWTGPQPSMADLAASVGVEKVLPTSEIAKSLGGQVHYLPPYRERNTLKLAQWLGESAFDVQGGVSIDLIRAVISLRAYKSDEEIEQLHDAVSITSLMHQEAMKMARPGMVEREIVAHLNEVALSKGAGISFPPIVTINGQTLHNHYYGNTMQSGRLLLCDSGAENLYGYSGDMTRTYPVDRTFTQQQKEVYQIVLNALKSSADMSKPGVTYQEVHLNAARVIISGLKEIGLMSGDVDEAVTQGAHALFFPHGLGHSMGMDVHDMEDFGENYVGYNDVTPRSTQLGLSALRFGKALEERIVLTNEPGIYFIPELYEQWKSENKFAQFINYDKVADYLDFGGIRIENDYVITGEGAQLLGAPAPMEVADVEALRQG